MTIKSLDEFKKFVYEKEKGDYIVTGTEFLGTTKKISIKHLKCGTQYLVTPEKFFAGRRCPECAKKIRSEKIHKQTTKTLDNFKKEVYNLVGDEYEVLGDYVNNKEKILMKHNVCNTTFLVPPNKFLRGQRCKYCYNKRRTKTLE